MKKQVKEQWIAALRGEEYHQTVGALHRTATSTQPERFCCLGVLCDLAVKAGVEVEVWPSDGSMKYDGTGTALPESVMSWAGLDEIDPSPVAATVSGEKRRGSLINANDDWRLSFPQIADLIERDIPTEEES